MTGIMGVTFLLYKDEQGGAPLWLETQNVSPDKSGHYNVQLGATSAQGMPSDLFKTGEARWLAVQISGQPEQTRTLLVAVPYAMKAADAETIGGLPPSAFVLAAPAAVASDSNVATTASNPGLLSPATASNVTTSGGTPNAIPMFTTATNIQNSILTQSGTTAVNVAGKLNLPASGTATSSSGFNSRPLDFVASAYNSTSKAAVSQSFQFQAEPASNNTASPTGTLNLLFASGTAAPAETGLKITSKGILTAAQFAGSGAGLTSLPAGKLTGAITDTNLPSDVARLALANKFTNVQSITAKSSSGYALTVTNSNTSGEGIFGAGYLGIYGQGSGNGVYGTTNASNGVGVWGYDPNGYGVFGSSESIYPAVFGQNTDASEGYGVEGSSLNSFGIGVYGLWSSSSTYGGDEVGPAGVWGDSSSGYGVTGSSDSSTGVYGISGSNVAVEGFGGYNTNDSSAVGVLGVVAGGSASGQGFSNVGVWGDTSQSSGFAVVGTADNGNALWGKNNTANHEALYVENDASYSSGSPVPAAARFAGPGAGTYCTIQRNTSNNGTGDLICTGTKSAAVPISGQRMVRMYAVEAADNWFEDAGSGQLSSGSTHVSLESTFGETVNAGLEYHVFLTPKGDCEGLYVSNETNEGFDVHELRGGHSSIAFDYRIMARRRGFENVRMEDVTTTFAQFKREADEIAARAAANKAAALVRRKPHTRTNLKPRTSAPLSPLATSAASLASPAMHNH
jgi:hypothetical protein